MILDRFGSLNDRLQPGVPCPEVPLFQESLSLFAVRLVEEILEYQADLIGTGSFEVLAREIENASPLRPAQAARVCQPQKSCLFQILARYHLNKSGKSEGRPEGAKRPTAGYEPREFTSRGEGGRVPRMALR